MDEVRPGAQLLSDQIRMALADEISAGLLPGGTPLDEQQLASRFGASRTPVREALRQLQVMGLVETRPRRGMTVRELTPARIMQMFEAMTEMEVMCVRLATSRMTSTDFGRIVQIHQEAKAAAEAENFNDYDRLNKQFHEAIYKATANEFLVEEVVAMRTRLEAFRRTQLRHAGRVGKSWDEHDDLVEAMSQRNADEAARRMNAHMMNAAASMSRVFAESADPAVSDRSALKGPSGGKA